MTRLLVSLSLCVGIGAVFVTTTASDARSPRILFTSADACPLTDLERMVAVQAFEKMMPVFQHPRCANCHGAIDVFAEDAEQKHGGGRMDERNPRTCDNCHEVEGWRQPPLLMDIGFAGQSAATICMQIKRERGPMQLLQHVADDALIEAAFEGRRGQSDLKPLPPPLTHDQFEALNSAWVAAVVPPGQHWPGGARSDCGCLPPQAWAGEIAWSGDAGAASVGMGQSSGSIKIKLVPQLEPGLSGPGKLSYETASGTVSWRAKSSWQGRSVTPAGSPCTITRTVSDSGQFSMSAGDGPSVTFGIDHQGHIGPDRYTLVLGWSGPDTPLYTVHEQGCGRKNSDTRAPVSSGVADPVGGVLPNGADVLEGDQRAASGYRITWKLRRVPRPE